MRPQPNSDLDLGTPFESPGDAPSFNLDDLSLLFEESIPGEGTFEMGPDGQMKQVFPEDDLLPAVSSNEHNANLADEIEGINPEWMTKTASELLDAIDDDIRSRQPWVDRYRRGMEMMGLLASEIDDGPFPGASTAVMPVISEAVVQFWARAMAEHVPSDGPVKGTVLGKSSKMLAERAKRVADYMNHDVMFLDRSWYTHHSRMMFALPCMGTTFKKTFRDHELGRNTGVYVSGEDFICNYHFSDLDSAARYTHRFFRSPSEVRRAQVAGIYRDIDLGEPQAEELDEVTEIKLEVSDNEPGDAGSGIDDRHEIYEVYVEIDLPGPYADPDRIPRPYIITIDKNSEKILAIYRDWKEQDPLKRRRTIFTQYDFLPGPGLYGFGLFHMIGGLQEAATGALRLIIDGSATASLQGGFISEDAALADQNLTVEPGVWKKVKGTAEDLNKAFVTPPYKEPSAVLFQILGFLVQAAQKFTATTEMMTGGGDSKGAPVGSTVAMIEQGGKVFSTIHRGLHRSLAQELRVRFEMVQEYMPVEGYPYDVDGAHEGIFAEDFAPGVSIMPVSDPNIFSQVQRVALNQVVYDLATQNPDLLKRPVAVRRVLEGLNVPDIDELFITNEPPPPMDPVTQVEALLRGEPVQAYPDQNHLAHLQHLSAFAQNPEFGGNPQVQQQVGPAFSALVGQHAAYAWKMHARQLGVPTEMSPPPMQPEEQAPPMGMPMQPQMPMLEGPPAGDPMQGQMGPVEGPVGGPPNPMMGQADQPAPPEVVAQIAAQIAPQMAQVPGIPSPTAQADQARSEAEAQKAQAEAQKIAADAQRQQVDAAQKQQDLALKVKDMEMKEADLALKRQEAMKRDEERAMKQLAEAEKMQREKERDQLLLIKEAQKAQQEEQRHQQTLGLEAERLQIEREMARVKAAILAAESEAKQKAASQPATAEASRNSDAVLAHLAETMTKMALPKKIVRDEMGRAIGVASVDMMDTPAPAKPKKKKGV